MPVRLLTTAERDRLSRFPTEVSREDLAAHFALSDTDLDAVRQQRGDANRLGFAVQLAALRFLGFVPADLGTAPAPAVAYLADQIGVAPAALSEYAARAETARDHQALAAAHLGLRRATATDLERLEDWLAQPLSPAR